VLKFSGFLGYPEAEYVLVDLTIEGVYFGQGILTRDVWEKLKLLDRPVTGLPNSIIQVIERGKGEQGMSLVTKLKENDPGSHEGRPGGPEILSLSATDESPAKRVNRETHRQSTERRVSGE
jgi:hypothetical protein